MAERIQYKLCVLVYRCLRGSAPCYIQQTIRPVASMESRRRLRSVTSSDLMVPATRRSTLGDRAFAVAGPRAWNNLQDAIRHSSSPVTSTFKTLTQDSFFSAVFFSAGIKFTHRPKIQVFRPAWGDSLHRFTSNMAWPTAPGPLGCAKFHLNRRRGWECGPKIS